MKTAVKRAQRGEDEHPLTNIALRHIQNVAGEKVLELLFATCDTA